MLNKYNPSEIETKHYQNWEQNDAHKKHLAKHAFPP